MPPPHGLSRGNVFLSSNSVDTPQATSVMPAIEPAGPPPTTMTSASRVVIDEVTPETYPLWIQGGQEAPGDIAARRLLPVLRRVSNSYLPRLRQRAITEPAAPVARRTSVAGSGVAAGPGSAGAGAGSTAGAGAGSGAGAGAGSAAGAGAGSGAGAGAGSAAGAGAG